MLEQICILKLNGILKFMAYYTRIHIFALLKPFHRNINKGKTKGSFVYDVRKKVENSDPHIHNYPMLVWPTPPLQHTKKIMFQNFHRKL